MAAQKAGIGPAEEPMSRKKKKTTLRTRLGQAARAQKAMDHHAGCAERDVQEALEGKLKPEHAWHSCKAWENSIHARNTNARAIHRVKRTMLDHAIRHSMRRHISHAMQRIARARARLLWRFPGWF